MNRLFASSLMVIAAYGFSSQALGECSQLTKEYIQNSGGNKEAAIARTRKMVADTKNDKSGLFWKLPRNQRQEMFAALDADAIETISNIQSCTESDLASITPKAKASQSGGAGLNPTQRCGSRIDTGTWNWGAWRVVSESPLSVLREGDTIPSPESTWKSDLFRNINYTINNNAEESERRGAQKIKDWLICLSGRGSTVTASAGAASAHAGPNVGNASEVIGQRSNRKNAFNPTSPHGDSARNQSGSSDGECKNGDPSCAIRGCNRSGGKAITYRNTAGCGVVSCRFADTKYDWSSVYNNIPGSGCVGSTK